MKTNGWHRAKIVCTLGPATDAPGVLEALIGSGLDVARVNMSHGSHDDHARRIASVRATAEQLQQPVAILADIPGPKFRLGAIGDEARHLVEHTEVALTYGSAAAGALPVRNPELLAALAPGESVYLADGAVELRVLTGSAEAVLCTVVIGGAVRSGSGINVPTANLGNLVPTPDDRRHIAFAMAQGVEWLGVSFVQRAEDLQQVRACFPPGAHAFLMAKIEKRRALTHLESIIEAADGVMVARGDLGVETDLAEIPLVQKSIIAAANALGKPVVTATQMLESMIEHEHPTRAEVTDVANAVLDGTDAVMLSGETAVGRYPAAAVRILDRVLAATEKQYADTLAERALRTAQAHTSDAVSFAACQLARRLGAAAIIASVTDLPSAAAVARFRPSIPILIATTDEAFARSLSMVRGIVPLHCNEQNEPAMMLDVARQWLFARAMATNGAKVVLVSTRADAWHADTLQVAAI